MPVYIFTRPTVLTPIIVRGVRVEGMHVASSFSPARFRRRLGKPPRSFTSFFNGPPRQSRTYADVIPLQHTPHRTMNVVCNLFRFHPRRRFLQVYQLGEDYRILTEYLEGIGQHESHLPTIGLNVLGNQSHLLQRFHPACGHMRIFPYIPGSRSWKLCDCINPRTDDVWIDYVRNKNRNVPAAVLQ